MKSLDEILAQAAELRVRLTKSQEEYKGLHQIDRLSGTGNRLRDKISHLKGQLAALGWVIYQKPHTKEDQHDRERGVYPKGLTL